MLSKNQIKYINSLKIKKNRHENRAFLVEGDKCVKELLNCKFGTKNVFSVEKWLDKNINLLDQKRINWQEITEEELKKISDLTTPNQVLAIAEMPLEQTITQYDLSDWVLALDEIKDPGNLGTIIRTADWFGIRTIICSNECVDVYNSKVIQASMGSFARVKTYYTDLVTFFKDKNKEMPIYATFLEGEPLISIEMPEKGILLIGSESDGISKKMDAIISKKINIPRFLENKNAQIGVDSLNASIATAIVCYEIRKK